MANQTHINLLKMHSKYVEEQEAYKEEAEKKIKDLERQVIFYDSRVSELISTSLVWQRCFEDLELYLVSKHGYEEVKKMTDAAYELTRQIEDIRDKRGMGYYKVVYVKPKKKNNE